MISRHLIWPPLEADAGQFRGRWVALDNCRFDGCSGQPIEGDVVDSDEDLAELCARLHEASRSRCTILYCDEDLIIEPSPPSSSVRFDSHPSLNAQGARLGS